MGRRGPGAQRGQHVADLVHVLAQRQGLAEGLDGLRLGMQRQQALRATDQCLGVVGLQRQRRVEAGQRLHGLVQRAQAGAAVAQGLGVLGAHGQRALEGLQPRPGAGPGYPACLPRLFQRGCAVRALREGAGQQAEGLVEAVGLARQHAQQVQRVEMRGRRAQHAAVAGLGLVQAALLVQGQALLEIAAGGWRHGVQSSHRLLTRFRPTLSRSTVSTAPTRPAAGSRAASRSLRERSRAIATRASATAVSGAVGRAGVLA